MGFVYYSNEDSGLRANGNASATNFATDHRPVVFDVFLPRDPAVPFTPPEDVNANGAVDIEDLYLWENGFALAAPPLPIPAPDINGNRNIELADRDIIRTALRAGESADVIIQ